MQPGSPKPLSDSRPSTAKRSRRAATAVSLLAGVALLGTACENPQAFGDPNALQQINNEQVAPPTADMNASIPAGEQAASIPAGEQDASIPAGEQAVIPAVDTIIPVSTDVDGNVDYVGDEEHAEDVTSQAEDMSAAHAAASDPDAPVHSHGQSPQAALNLITAAIPNSNIKAETKAEVQAAFGEVAAAVLEALNSTNAMDDNYLSLTEILEINQYLQANYPEWQTWQRTLVKLYRDRQTVVYNDMTIGALVATLANLGSDYRGPAHKGRFVAPNDNSGATLSSAGYSLNKLFGPDGPHSFVGHVIGLLGTDALAPGQQVSGGFERIDDNTIRAVSPITGLRPVIEQAIDQVVKKGADIGGERTEAKVAKQLTQLNDWNQLKPETQEAIMILSGIDFAAMSKQDQELTINHLQHSPLPFGNLTDVLSPDTTIEYGYTHTLDKKRTRVQDLGNGQFRIFMISNNNNGSHTGHSLGSFTIQLGPDATAADAKKAGNNMVENTNNNNRLYLDETAKKVLYGEIPRLDFSGLTEDEKASLYKGNTL